MFAYSGKEVMPSKLPDRQVICIDEFYDHSSLISNYGAYNRGHLKSFFDILTNIKSNKKHV